MQGQPVIRGDFARPGLQEPGVPAVHLRPQAFKDIDRLADVRTHGVLSDPAPARQFDKLAVQQGDLRVRVEGRSRDELGQRSRLARARLPAEQHIAFRQTDRDRHAVLVDTDRDRVPQRHPRPRQERPGRSGSGQGVSAHDGRCHRGCVEPGPFQPDLARPQTHRQRVGRLLQRRRVQTAG